MEPGNGEWSGTSSTLDDFLNLYEFEEEDWIPPFQDLTVPFFPSDLNPTSDLHPSSVGSFHLDVEGSKLFSDIALKYIGELLEEDINASNSFNEEIYPALQSTEKPFYEILGEKYPPSPYQLRQHADFDTEGRNHRADDVEYNNCAHVCKIDTNTASTGACTIFYGVCCKSIQDLLMDSGDCASQSSFNSSDCPSNVFDGLNKSLTDKVGASGVQNNSISIWHQYQRGLEEASKFLPHGDYLTLNSEEISHLPSHPKEVHNGEDRAEKDGNDHPAIESSGRRKIHSSELGLEGERSYKVSATFSRETVKSETFDMVLLCGGTCGVELPALREALQMRLSLNSKDEQSNKSKGGRKSRGKRRVIREVVDLGSLLNQCAQAISLNDHKAGKDLLKQIRQYSSPFGDGSQRLAHYFADGLQARLDGIGEEVYGESTKQIATTTDMLKVWHLFLAACPFIVVVYSFANQTILDTLGDAPRLHIVDFGIFEGFQWPSLFQRLAERSCGPPSVRMTAIDYPQPGFRPEDKVKEIGHRLTNYAERFNIHFDFVPIVCRNWEAIHVGDLKLEKDEVLIVNALHVFNKLADETLINDSPRDIVLKTIREMNPNVFIHAVVSGSFNAPIFLARFQEAFFHWSTLFDFLETNIAREQPERIVAEREFLGKEILNVIACEGKARIEKPETYKQWRVRMTRVGFLQLPLNQDILKRLPHKVHSNYHKHFLVEEDLNFCCKVGKDA